MNNLIGVSKAIDKLRKRIKELARTRKDVIIIGESGVGKSVVAESIHHESKDAKKPYVRLNVPTIEETRLSALVESLVARRKFLNPLMSHHGDIHLPRGSTLIIEDIEQSSFTAQKALCNLFEVARKQKLGYRFLLLTDQPIEESLKAGEVLERLAGEVKKWDTIIIPPLRKRPEDMPHLVKHFVREITKAFGLKDMVIDSNGVGVLVRQEWKGNVQELKSLIERSILRSEDKEVFRLPEELIDEQSELGRILERIEKGVEFAVDHSMELIEKRIFERVLEKFDDNQSRAARFLKITEDTLRYRMKKLGLPTAQEESSPHSA